jgi:hypothetical protein
MRRARIRSGGGGFSKERQEEAKSMTREMRDSAMGSSSTAFSATGVRSLERVRPFLLGVLLLGMLLLPERVFAWNGALEVMRLAREAPATSAFGDASGMVWLREMRYRLEANGDMVRESRWVVLLGPGVSEEWRTWQIPVPEGGDASVSEAALYSVPLGRLVSPLLPQEQDREGVRIVEVRIPPLSEQTALALAYTQVYPRRLNVDDLIWLELDLPQWEQRYVVDVPRNAAFLWGGEGVPEPGKSEAGAGDRYSWLIMNRTAWKGTSLLAKERPALAFSLRKGRFESLRPLAELETITIPSPEGGFVRAATMNNRTRAGEALLAAMNTGKTLLSGVPWDWVRSAEEIPGEGPWTPWERVLVLKSWLRNAGWKAVVWWVPALPLAEDAPATSRAWLRPVLECTPPNGGSFYCDLGQNVAAGNVPPSLRGKTLYRAEGLGVESRAVPGGALEEHRLSLEWILSMDQTGMSQGTFDVTVRGGWVDLFSPGGVPDGAQILSLLPRPAGGAFVFGAPVLPTYPYGYRVSFPVQAAVGIPAPGQVLVRIPAVELPWLRALEQEQLPLRLRFPFVVEQKLDLSLPEGYRVLSLPPSREGEGRIALRETLRFSEKRNAVLGETKLVVKTQQIDASMGEALRQLIAAWASWGSKTLPVRAR